MSGPARAARALLAAAVAVLALAAGAAPASPQGGSGDGDDDTTHLRLLGRDPWVGDGLDFALSVQGTAVPDGATMRLQVHDRVRSRSEFVRSVAGDALRSVLWVDGPVPAAEGPTSFTVPLTGAPERTTAPIDAPGVYPVTVDLFDADGAELASLHTHLVRLPAPDPDSERLPLDVALVAELTAEPLHLELAGDGSGGPDVPDDLVAVLDALTTALGAHPDLPLNLAVSPESLAALAEADPGAVDGLAAVLGDSEVLGGPWVAVDEAAWEANDPALLVQLRSRGAAAIAGGLREAGTTRLLAGASLGTIATAVEEGTDLVVVDDDALEPLDEGDFPYTLARPFRLALTPAPAGDEAGDEPDEGPTIAAVGADRGLAELAATADDDPVLAAALVLADLAVIGDDEPASARLAVLRLPAEAVGSAEFLGALLDGLEPPEAPAPPPPPTADPDTGEVPEAEPAVPAAPPRLRARTLADAVGEVDTAGAGGILDGPDDPLVRRLLDEGTFDDVSALARRLADSRVDLESYRTVFGDDQAAERAARVLDTVAAAALDDDQRADGLASVAAHIEGGLAGLRAPELQRVSLTDREGLVQLVFTNETDSAADVALQMRADRLVLPDAAGGVLQVHLEPATETRVELRVRARSSGDAPLDIRITSPDGRLHIGDTRVAVRTTAVSGVGIVLMVGALAFLAVWWTRTIVREHRARHPRRMAHAKRSGPGPTDGTAT